MNYKNMFEKVKSLGFDKELIISKEDRVELFILRPSKLSKRFKTSKVL